MCTILLSTNLNDYYDIRLKQWRLDRLHAHENSESFTFLPLDVENLVELNNLFRKYGPFEAVLSLAARAGVRYSMENPHIYLSTNTVGTLNLLECMRESSCSKMVLASTSSLYAGQKMPFAEDLPVNEPLSPYAASKKAAELMAFSYHKLYETDVSVVRYFTVFGPAGRPDMSIFRFIRWIAEGEPIELFGDGSQSRDFTYVDDIVEGVVRVMNKIPQPVENWTPESDDASRSSAPYKIYNIGNHSPVELGEFIETLEKALGVEAQKNYLPMQPGDVLATSANVDDLMADVGFAPDTPLAEGLGVFVQWYRDFYEV